MVGNFLMRRGGFLVLAASILVLLLAGTSLAEKTTMELHEDGSTRETTDYGDGNVTTVDTSNPSADGVQTITTTTVVAGGEKTIVEKEEFKNGKLISRQIETNDPGFGIIGKQNIKFNEQGQTTYESYEVWEKGKLLRGHRTTKTFDSFGFWRVTSTENYQPKTQTWVTEEPPKTAEEKPEPVQPKTAEEQPKTPETPGGVKAKPTSFYIEPYIGVGGLGPNHSFNVSSNAFVLENDQAFNTHINSRSRGRMDVTATGGVSLGTWFNYGCMDLPPWLQYFGFCLNYMYHVLEYGSHGGQDSQGLFFPSQVDNVMGDCTLRSTGSVHTLGFMVKGRYGFFPDDEVPFGRVEGWVGIGPSINIVSQNPSVKLNNVRTINGEPNFDSLNTYTKFNSTTSTVPGLQMSVGVRYNIRRYLSTDAFLQYDHFTPNFSLNGPGGTTGKFNPTVDHFSVNLGMAYQF
jgi:hypothetical protein